MMLIVLLQAGLKTVRIDINAANQSGNTALICAADNGRTAAIRALLAVH